MERDVPSISLRVAGGPEAPRVARAAVRGQLDAHLGEEQASDVALIVSELVTNSVRHASVGVDGEILVEALHLGDHLLVSVVDPGSSHIPHLADAHADQPSGIGLRLVARLSSSWGFARDGSGVTRVWCHLPLR
jgi:anti-sigma regulatory factor (Ser/Thr protein kinase)